MATVSFSYETQEGGSNANIDLLMLALPHHLYAIDTISSSPSSPISTKRPILPVLDANYTCIKGNMTPIVGNQWVAYVETLTELNLGSEGTITNTAAVDEIHRNLLLDSNIITPTAKDVYGFGKQIARMAQLVHISDTIGVHTTDNTIDVANKTAETVAAYLGDWFDGKRGDALVYDIDIGGIVSKDGLENPQADFGNGWYNDQ